MFALRIAARVAFVAVVVTLAFLAGKLLFVATGHHLGLFLAALFGLFVVSRAVRFAVWRRRGWAGGCGYGRSREAVSL